MTEPDGAFPLGSEWVGGTMTSNIYALIDPRTKRVHYIGKTINLRARFHTHLSWARSGNDRSIKADWLRDLLASDMRPIMMTLQEVCQEDSREIELAWIAHGKRHNWPLLNNRHDLAGT